MSLAISELDLTTENGIDYHHNKRLASYEVDHLDNLVELCKFDQKMAYQKAVNLLRNEKNSDQFDDLLEKIISIIK